MGECFTCEGAAEDRYTMVLEAERVLDDVPMCDACYSSYDGVSWIEIEITTTTTVGGAPCRPSEAMD